MLYDILEISEQFSYAKDETIYSELATSIFLGGDIRIVNICPDGNIAKLSKDVTESTHVIFGDKESVDMGILENVRVVSIPQLERILSSEYISDDIVFSTDRLDRSLDRFFSEIRHSSRELI